MSQKYDKKSLPSTFVQTGGPGFYLR